jgi:predicted  nucleic acid-binding Zn-ribbon protein
VTGSPSSAAHLDSALAMLEAALSRLESAAKRKLDLERRRGDLETELAIMQDDRSRLATDLDGALSRLRTVETAAGDAVTRLDRAMMAIHAVLDETGGADQARSPGGEH